MDAIPIPPSSMTAGRGRATLVASAALHAAMALALLIPGARPTMDSAPPVVVELMTPAGDSDPAPAPAAAAPASTSVATPTPQPPAKLPSRPVPPRARPAAAPSKPVPVPSPTAATPVPVSDTPTASEAAASSPVTTNAAAGAAAGPSSGTGIATGDGTTGQGRGNGDAAPGYTLGAPQTPAPDYPWSARRRGVEGWVVVRLDVGADGCPTRVELIHSSGDDALDRAAITTIRHWRLRPALAGGVPAAGRVVVPIVFKLT